MKHPGRKSALIVGLAVTLVCTLLFLFSVRGGSGFLAQVELKTLDLRFAFRGPLPTDQRIVILAIDQKSVDAIGRWPWPRATIAELLGKVAQGQPRTVALDIAFPLPEKNPLQAMRELPLPEGWSKEDLEEFIARQDGDRLLVRQVRQSGNVVLGFFFLTSKTEAAHQNNIAEPAVSRPVSIDRFRVVKEQPGGRLVGGVPQAEGLEANIAALSEAAAGEGFFNVTSDADGATRRLGVVMRYGDYYYPSLALKALGNYLDRDVSDIVLMVQSYGLDPIKVTDREIPLDGAGKVSLNFCGPASSYKIISVVDLISGRTDPAALKDKLVLLGATAVGIGDTAVTPFAPHNDPGIGIHATFIDNALNGDFLVRPDWASAVELILLIVLGFLLTQTTLRFGPVGAPLAALAALLVFLGGAQILFVRSGIVIGLVFPSVTIMAVFVSVLVVRLLTEVRQRIQIKRAFARYLHPAIVERISHSPESLALGGEKREITVLFADIKGFTKVAAGRDPKELISYLNEYLDRMTGVLFDCRALVDKYIGDAVMAFWGAPERQDNHIDLALGCALKMIEQLKLLNEQWSKRGLPRLEIRIGISSGEAIVGNVGSSVRVDYTAMGDCVNLASRLEQAGKRHPGTILVDRETASRAAPEFSFEEVGREVLIDGLGQTVIHSLEIPTVKKKNRQEINT